MTFSNQTKVMSKLEFFLVVLMMITSTQGMYEVAEEIVDLQSPPEKPLETKINQLTAMIMMMMMMTAEEEQVKQGIRCSVDHLLLQLQRAIEG